MAKKILIVDGHPDRERGRLCHALADAYVDGAMAAGKQIRLITLAETPIEVLRSVRDFASAPRDEAVQSAQADIAWADHVVLVFPLWLGGAPALLRAFLEQVARGSFFATTTDGVVRPKLRGKSARIIVTMGMPAFAYRLLFHAPGVHSIMQGVLGFAGFAPVRATMFGAVEAVSPSRQQARIELVRMLGRGGQ